jgi:uncharacterized protein (TIGR00251 family)
MEAVQLALTREGAVRFEVRAQPRARASRIATVRAGALVVQVTAPPQDGEANDELVATLARALSVAKRDVAIVRGAASRAKVVDVVGLGLAEVRARLMAAMA